mgnify:CR=1 FL=1
MRAGERRDACRHLVRALAALCRPDTTLSFSIQVDVLVMVVVGGMGSVYKAEQGQLQTPR